MSLGWLQGVVLLQGISRFKPEIKITKFSATIVRRRVAGWD
jgi:hypothetical protein